jgi:protein-L-isoaspartate(D-aspartate) O-methyltransferase
VIPVGGKWGQKLQRWVRKEDNYHCEDIVPVAFVPLRGEEGWNDKDWQR